MWRDPLRASAGMAFCCASVSLFRTAGAADGVCLGRTALCDAAHSAVPFFLACCGYFLLGTRRTKHFAFPSCACCHVQAALVAGLLRVCPSFFTTYARTFCAACAATARITAQDACHSLILYTGGGWTLALFILAFAVAVFFCLPGSTSLLKDVGHLWVPVAFTAMRMADAPFCVSTAALLLLRRTAFANGYVFRASGTVQRLRLPAAHTSTLPTCLQTG